MTETTTETITGEQTTTRAGYYVCQCDEPLMSRSLGHSLATCLDCEGVSAAGFADNYRSQT